MRNVAREVISKAKSMGSGSKAREFAAAKSKKASPASTAAVAATTKTATEPKPGGKNVAVKTKTSTSPVQMKKVSKKTAYDVKEASNPKLKASARKHYAMNAQAAMKNKKKK
jgi:hypothetical protein